MERNGVGGGAERQLIGVLPSLGRVFEEFAGEKVLVLDEDVNDVVLVVVQLFLELFAEFDDPVA